MRVAPFQPLHSVRPHPLDERALAHHRLHPRVRLDEASAIPVVARIPRVVSDTPSPLGGQHRPDLLDDPLPPSGRRGLSGWVPMNHIRPPKRTMRSKRLPPGLPKKTSESGSSSTIFTAWGTRRP